MSLTEMNGHRPLRYNLTRTSSVRSGSIASVEHSPSPIHHLPVPVVGSVEEGFHLSVPLMLEHGSEWPLVNTLRCRRRCRDKGVCFDQSP